MFSKAIFMYFGSKIYLQETPCRVFLIIIFLRNHLVFQTNVAYFDQASLHIFMESHKMIIIAVYIQYQSLSFLNWQNPLIILIKTLFCLQRCESTPSNWRTVQVFHMIQTRNQPRDYSNLPPQPQFIHQQVKDLAYSYKVNNLLKLLSKYISVLCKPLWIIYVYIYRLHFSITFWQEICTKFT